MCETREPSARLVGPFSGEVNVSQNRAISIRFESQGMSKGDVFICLNGEKAISNGHPERGYELMEIVENCDYLYVKFRKSGGLPRREIFVSAKCGDCFAIEQRFFVSGCSTVAKEEDLLYHNRNKDKKAKHRKFWAKAEILEDGILYKNWQGEKKYDIKGVLSVSYSEEWINLSMPNNKTLHRHCAIPTNDRNDWIDMSISEVPVANWNRIFFRDTHVWWNESLIITRCSVNPFIGSDDILWTKDDIGVETITSVREVDRFSFVINESKRINCGLIEVIDL